MGALLLLYSIFVIYRGRMGSSNDYDTTFISRTDNPVRFWIAVVLMWTFAAVLLLNVFDF
jgi:hypothetical protein